MKITSYLFLSVCIFAAPFLYADDFNPFGDGEADGGKSGAANFGISIGGEISAGTTFYFEDIKNGADSILPGNLVKGRLDFSAKGDFAEAFISLKVEPVFAASNLNIKTLFPVYADEMYASFYYNAQGRTAFILSAGLRKLNWGKADSDGPLDVINPHDYSDLSEV
ncbi:MAG: hypothetical protein LBG79_01505, partial [Spirochaetaceae bacterium]|nr:hypothetical protein [Spirochaetaceae bacterium]